LDKLLIDLLMSEIKNQCEMVEIAVNGINHFHNNESIPVKQLWFNVQGLLIATANISKIFWNYERTESEEVTYLKGLLEVNDTSKIKSRFFRNIFEHYDENIIEWSSKRTSNSVAISNVLPKSTNLGIPTNNTFKTYYNDVNSIAFQNKEYKLQPVIKEVARIYEKIKSIDDVFFSYYPKLDRKMF
jgi:hypothetical protein